MTQTFEYMLDNERDLWIKSISPRLQGVIDKSKQVDNIVGEIVNALDEFYPDKVVDKVDQPIFDSLLELTAEIEKRIVFQILAENDGLEDLFKEKPLSK